MKIDNSYCIDSTNNPKLKKICKLFEKNNIFCSNIYNDNIIVWSNENKGYKELSFLKDDINIRKYILETQRIDRSFDENDIYELMDIPIFKDKKHKKILENIFLVFEGSYIEIDINPGKIIAIRNFSNKYVNIYLEDYFVSYYIISYCIISNKTIHHYEENNDENQNLDLNIFYKIKDFLEK